MSRSARVGIIPAAGRGTRMRPASEAVPKELLPIGGRPAIDWVLEEAFACGIEHVVVVTNAEKEALNRYLSSSYREGMRSSGHYDRPAGLGSDRAGFQVSLVEQAAPDGLGDAIRVGWESTGAGAVAVLLPDEVLLGSASPLRAMLELHARTRASVVSLVEVAPEAVSSYGCADVATRGASAPLLVRACVEKPSAASAPSNLAISGRYVLEREVLEAICRTGPDPRGEIQLTPALDASARSARLLGLVVAQRDALIDVGNWHGWLRANRLAFAAMGELEAQAVA